MEGGSLHAEGTSRMTRERAFPSHPLARCQTEIVSTISLNQNIVPSEKGSLYSQAKKTCDHYYHDHHTDDVKDVHCVLLRVRDAICLRDGISAIGAPRLVLSWVSKRCWSNHALIDQCKSV
jgi:hypothetical protein